MQLPLINEEKTMFEELSKSVIGQQLESYIERLIRHVESVRTQTNLSIEARIEVSNVLEENVLQRLKAPKQKVEAPEVGEYE